MGRAKEPPGRKWEKKKKKSPAHKTPPSLAARGEKSQGDVLWGLPQSCNEGAGFKGMGAH